VARGTGIVVGESSGKGGKKSANEGCRKLGKWDLLRFQGSGVARA